MAKLSRTYRLSNRALEDLARLSGLWGCDYTAAIERALSEADPSHMDVQERADTQAALEGPSTPVAEIIDPKKPWMPETAPVRQTKPHVHRQSIKKPEWKK